jgi:NADH-quinone oxidoreductase subunit E
MNPARRPMRREQAGGERMNPQLEAILSSRKKGRLDLIQILQDIQETFGFLPEDALADVAEYTGVPASQVFGTASFYGQFRFSPVGRRKVTVCRGTACHVRGAPRILEEVEKILHIKEGETTPDREYTLETVACIGCCGLSPCLVLDNEVHASLTPKQVKGFFSEPGE